MPSGALLIFPQGNPPPPIFRRAPRYLRRGLGQDEYDYYYPDEYYTGWGDGGESDFYGGGGDYYDPGYQYDPGIDFGTYDFGLPSDFPEEAAPPSEGWWPTNDPSLWSGETLEPFVPYTEEIVTPEEGFYGESINHLADIGILGAEEAAAVINGELDLQEALNISGYYGDYSAGLIPTTAQQAVADAQAKQDAAKKAAAAGGGGSGGGMSAGGGTPAQKSAQQQAAAAKTPAEIAAAQRAMAEANAAAGNWTEKDSLIPGVKNLYVVLGGVGAFLLLKGGSAGGGPAVSYTTVSPPATPRAPKKNPSRHRRHRRSR